MRLFGEVVRDDGNGIKTVKNHFPEAEKTIEDLMRRVARIETMLDLLGNIALYDPSCLTNQKIEYERLLNQIHEELWKEEEE